jgi:hypothetical protein
MKKISVFFASLFLMMLSLTASAQSKADSSAKPDYFVGKWDVLVEGTPQGDGKMLVTLERKDGKLTGTIVSKDGSTPANKIDRVEEKEKSVTVYFTASGYNVYLFLEKKDEDHVTGSMMDMFDAKGDRVKEKKS